MLNRYLKICSIQLVVLDFLWLNVLFFITSSWLERYDRMQDINVDIFLVVSNLSWLVALYTNGIYFLSQQLSFDRIARKTIQSLSLYLLLLLLCLFLSKQLYSRLFILSYCGGFTVMVLLGRWLFYRVTDHILHRNGVEKKW